MTGTTRGSCPRLRYKWGAGTGKWADARQLWADLPGRRYVSTLTDSADGRLSIAYQGFPEGLTYVLPYLRAQQAALLGGAQTTAGRAVSWRRIRQQAEGPENADLLFVGCSRRRAESLAGAESLTLPFRVHMLLDVEGDAATMLRRVSGNERRQFASLRRKRGWTCEAATDVADLRFFYERMHLPTMASRHGEESRSTDWGIALRALHQHGVLLLVKEEDRPVAGVLCRTEDDGRSLHMRLLGVLDGDESHYRSGAVKAVYYLTVEWAAEHGVQHIDFSGSDPFPGRGVFQFKRRFHPTIALPEDHYRDRRIHLRVLRDTDAVRDFLVATPMLTVHADGRIAATYFFDADRPPPMQIRSDSPGVTEVRTVDLDDFLTAADKRNTVLLPPAADVGQLDGPATL